MADARARKRAKYHDLVVAGRDAGYRVKLITIEVMLEDEAFKAFTILCFQTIRATILDVTRAQSDISHTSLLVYVCICNEEFLTHTTERCALYTIYNYFFS